jgi:hypothetical protein
VEAVVSGKNHRTRQSSQPEPAELVWRESNVVGGWLRWLTFALALNRTPMQLDVYVHDGRIRRVVEDTDRDTLTIYADLPVSPESDELAPCLLEFQNAYGYCVHEGPFKGCPAIFDMQVVGEEGRWHRVRIDTNAGYREFFCTGMERK